MIWDESKRPQKKEAREYALSNLSKKQHTLWLPGVDCLCVKEALKRGVVNGNGHFLFVEKNSEVVPSIKNFVRSRRWHNSPIIHEGELSKLVLPWPVDYAFLDFLGTFESQTSVWMSQNLVFAEGADLCVTHAYGRRYNLFLDRMEQVFKELPIYTALKHQLRCYDDLVALPLAMMKSMFNRYSFEIRWPCKYQDSVRSMLLFRLEKFHHLKHTNGWPDFISLVGRCGTSCNSNYERSLKMPAKTKAARSAAAKKAWETRRADAAERAASLSARAKKAWATRRKTA